MTENVDIEIKKINGAPNHFKKMLTIKYDYIPEKIIINFEGLELETSYDDFIEGLAEIIEGNPFFEDLSNKIKFT